MKKVLIVLMIFIVSSSFLSNNVTAVENNEENYPIIFIPGYAASELYLDEELSNKVFPFSGIESYFTLEGISKSIQNFINTGKLPNFGLNQVDSLHMNNKLYVRKPLNLHEVDNIEDYYGTIDAHKFLIDKLLEEFVEREVYFFSYDFRESNSVTAEKFRKFVDSLGVEKVNIIAHSMGGLVTSHYAVDYHDKINEAVIIGTPFEGSMLFLSSLITFNKLSETLELANATQGNLYKLAKTFQSFQSHLSLIPSEKLILEETISKRSLFKTKQITTSDYKKLVEKVTPYTYNMSLEEKSRILDNEINLLYNFDNIHFISGNNRLTPSSIVYSELVLMNRGKTSFDLIPFVLFQDMTAAGDYIVSTYSSTMANKLEGDERYKQFSHYDHLEIAGFNRYKCDATKYIVDIFK